jgi:hypothetical protein
MATKELTKAKAGSDGVPKKQLRGPQEEILKALASSSKPLTRLEIAEKSGVDFSKIGDYAGPRPKDQSEETRARWPFPDLYALKMVYIEVIEVGGKQVQVYEITDRGEKAHEEAGRRKAEEKKAEQGQKKKKSK